MARISRIYTYQDKEFTSKEEVFAYMIDSGLLTSRENKIQCKWCNPIVELTPASEPMHYWHKHRDKIILKE